MSPAHNNLPAESDEQSTVDTAVDCYSENERQSMEYGQRLRGALLLPQQQWLSACRISPDVATLFALLSGLTFAPLFLTENGWHH